MKKTILVIKISFLTSVLICFAFGTAVAAKAPKLMNEKARVDKVMQSDENMAKSGTAAFKREVLKYDSERLRDPFSSPFISIEPGDKRSKAKEVQLPDLAVQGLMWGGNYPQAIINNKVVKAGDTVAGVNIVEINNKEILVMYKDRHFSLPAPALTEKEIKKKSKGGKS